MFELKGIFAASLSILKSDLSLDIDNTIKHAENLILQGCHGVVIFGSTGQAQLISVAEKIKLIELYKNKLRFLRNEFELQDNIKKRFKELFVEGAISELNFEKRKVNLSIKLLEELQNKEAVSKFSSPLSGKNLPFSSLSEKLGDKKKKDEE